MKQVLIFLWLSSLLTYAQSLDDEIAAMLKAPPAQRYRLMNAIKRKIIKLKAQERRKAIEKLKQASKLGRQSTHKSTKTSSATTRQTGQHETNQSHRFDVIDHTLNDHTVQDDMDALTPFQPEQENDHDEESEQDD